MNSFFLILLSFFMLVVSSAQANDISLGLIQCGEIPDDVNRLVCFDKLANINKENRLTHHTSKNKVPDNKNGRDVVDVLENFGAEHLKAHGNEKQKSIQVVYTVSKLTKNQYKKWRITFANGQQWKQTDDGTIRLKVGDKALLTKGVFGAVYLKQYKIDSNRKIRVKRIK